MPAVALTYKHCRLKMQAESALEKEVEARQDLGMCADSKDQDSLHVPNPRILACGFETGLLFAHAFLVCRAFLAKSLPATATAMQLPS